jgi:hypothetical protein
LFPNQPLYHVIAPAKKSIHRLMTKYTEGQAHHRHASAVMNLDEAGGLAVWQYLSRTPKFFEAPISISNLGVFASIIGSARQKHSTKYQKTSVRNKRILRMGISSFSAIRMASIFKF